MNLVGKYASESDNPYSHHNWQLKNVDENNSILSYNNGNDTTVYESADKKYLKVVDKHGGSFTGETIYVYQRTNADLEHDGIVEAFAQRAKEAILRAEALPHPDVPLKDETPYHQYQSAQIVQAYANSVSLYADYVQVLEGGINAPQHIKDMAKYAREAERHAGRARRDAGWRLNQYELQGGK